MREIVSVIFGNQIISGVKTSTAWKGLDLNGRTMQLFKDRQSMPYAVLELTNLTLGGPQYVPVPQALHPRSPASRSVVTPDELAHASRVIQTLAPEACGLRTTLEKLLESAGQRKEAKAWGRSFVDAVLDAGARRPADWSEWADLADKHTIKRRRSFSGSSSV